MFDFFSTRGFKSYLNQAKDILDRNWTGRYTRPAPSLYPHQWNWDSGFIAIGYARYAPQRAMQELIALFENQWDNGMVPQISFNSNSLGHYFPEPDFWQAPQGRMTSGITMPPTHALALSRIWRQAGDRAEVRDFVRFIYPKIMGSHRFFYHERDPKAEGLVYIRHPWESGLDNSPNWDGPLGRMEIDREKLPQYKRLDLGHGVPAEQRPSNEDYDRYVLLVDLFRRNNYDEAAIYQQCPFLIKDVLFNSILCAANHDLVEVGEGAGLDVGEAREWHDQTAKAIRESLWCPEREQFDPFDINLGEHLTTATAASFTPLFASAATIDQAEKLYQRLDSVSFCALNQGNCFTIPNFDMARHGFDSKNYWRGPVWININWLLSRGLRNYGYRTKSDAMNKDLIQLPIRFGFHEYYDSITGRGYGSDSFSWTAALFIDLVSEYYDQKEGILTWIGRAGSHRLKEKQVLNKAVNRPTGPAPSDLGERLMAAIGRLKKAFYDRSRGRVDYKAMKSSDEYEEYLDLASLLCSFDPASLSGRREKTAFWINLYNTIVVHGIVALAIEESVKETINFFTHIGYEVGGKFFSPDDMEHGILRANATPPRHLLPVFGYGDERKKLSVSEVDPRIHFALVCGSRSCAPIDYYEAENIDEQLDRAAAHFINSSELLVAPEKNKVMLSQIFKWYETDFGGRDKLFEFICRYLADEDKVKYLMVHGRDIDVEYLFYDWNLNH